jgi:mRNA interferase MazF
MSKNAADYQREVVRNSEEDLEPGDIVRVDFPHIRPKKDATGNIIETSKERPALIIYKEKKQIVVAYISSVLPDLLNPADVLILRTDVSFNSTGLDTSSVIRLGVLVTIKLNDVIGWYGLADDALRKEINAKLSACFRI